MKISRLKKSHKILAFFATNFDFREPYQVLIDATFCQAALQNKVDIDQQLRRLFQTQLKLVTTQCIILEAESLGAQVVGATAIVKRFAVHKCDHIGTPVSATECIRSMTKASRYVVATQDRSLQEKLRKVPGRCLLYLHKATPVLEGPSLASKKYVLKKSQNLLPVQLESKIEHLKRAQGMPVPVENVDKLSKKPKGPKNPNPLSCKKSKKQKTLNINSKTETKTKRKRIKIPDHVKQALKEGGAKR